MLYLNNRAVFLSLKTRNGKCKDEELETLLWVLQPSKSSSKPNINGMKLVLCICWDHRGVIYYDLLNPNETIIFNMIYRTQLMRLSRNLISKNCQKDRSKLWLALDNTLNNIFVTKKKVLFIKVPISNQRTTASYRRFRFCTRQVVWQSTRKR